jgi:hypothetical protein
MSIRDKIQSVFEQAEQFTGQDPFLKKVYEYQMKGIEFAEIQPFKRYAVCTNKNENQHDADPLVYYTVVMENDKFRYFQLSHKNADWQDNNATEITEEDFEFNVRPANTNDDILDIRDKDLVDKNQLTPDETIQNS